jgi:hypothetical protein
MGDQINNIQQSRVLAEEWLVVGHVLDRSTKQHAQGCSWVCGAGVTYVQIVPVLVGSADECLHTTIE